MRSGSGPFPLMSSHRGTSGYTARGNARNGVIAIRTMKRIGHTNTDTGLPVGLLNIQTEAQAMGIAKLMPVSCTVVLQQAGEPRLFRRSHPRT